MSVLAACLAWLPWLFGLVSHCRQLHTKNTQSLMLCNFSVSQVPLNVQLASGDVPAAPRHGAHCAMCPVWCVIQVELVCTVCFLQCSLRKGSTAPCALACEDACDCCFAGLECHLKFCAQDMAVHKHIAKIFSCIICKGKVMHLGITNLFTIALAMPVKQSIHECM